MSFLYFNYVISVFCSCFIHLLLWYLGFGIYFSILLARDCLKNKSLLRRVLSQWSCKILVSLYWKKNNLLQVHWLNALLCWVFLLSYLNMSRFNCSKNVGFGTTFDMVPKQHAMTYWLFASFFYLILYHMHLN